MRARQRWMGFLVGTAFVGVVAGLSAWGAGTALAAPRAVLVEEFTSQW